MDMPERPLFVRKALYSLLLTRIFGSSFSGFSPSFTPFPKHFNRQFTWIFILHHLAIIAFFPVTTRKRNKNKPCSLRMQLTNRHSGSNNPDILPYS